MGLDIYFHKRNYSDHNPNEPIGKDEEGKNIYEDMGKDIAYFRKVNFLMSYFNYLEGEDDNCYYKEIERSEIEDLVEDCDYTLQHKAEILEGKMTDIPLEPTGGFFFGSTDIDEYFFDEVKDVMDTFKEVLDNLSEDEQVFMYCWW